MIEYITGELILVREDSIIIEQNGMGYNIMMALSSINNMPSAGTFVKVYTYLHVREDILALYGFSNRDDLETFKLLITVSGIGPKGALAILSVITPDDLRFAVLSEDVKTITKAPGVGAKTAKKLILELKDKLKLDDTFETSVTNNKNLDDTHLSHIKRVRNETIEALEILGYSTTDASKVVRSINIDDKMTAEEALKISLKQLV